MTSSTPSARASWLARLAVVTALVGIGSGVAGLLVSISLRAIEHLAYGYRSGTFLDGVTSSSAGQRVLALTIAGIIGGVGWWALRRWGRRVVSVEQNVAGEKMPTVPTLINVGLQVVVVGLGASIGREVAPRELGALLAAWLSDRAGVTARERRILVACGAGAGLAAVYDVPLSGAVFAVEVLLAELSFATALPALATSAIATVVAQLAVPSGALYTLPSLTLTPSLFVWAVIVGPVMGFAAVGFTRLVTFFGAHRATGSRLLLVMPAIFALVGVLAIPFPEILGNGAALGDVAFAGTASILVLGLLAVVKTGSTVATIGAGAAGGTLTPSLAIGAALGGSLGGLWSLAWPGTPLAAFAFVAAAAFLASSLRAPFTALILMVEFTNQGPALLVPTMLAIAGSVMVSYLLGRARITGVA